MAPAYLLVQFPGDVRAVLVDGVPQGWTNIVLALEPGSHRIALDPATGASPPQQTVRLAETSATDPFRVQFQLAEVRQSSPASVPEGWVPVARARSLKPSRTVAQALEVAEHRARSAGGPIDSTLLLFALANIGPGQDEGNTAALLAESIGSGSSALEATVQEHLERQPDRGRWPDLPVHFTAGAWRILESARQLQKQISSKDPYVAARHVMAAFLTSSEEQPPDGALTLLTRATVDLDRLREAFRERMLASSLPDTPNAWRRLPLRPVVPRAFISRFNADLSAGDDKLGIRRDVNAMANLMASRALVPPLSIGLFGNWGSGKSFFITKLEQSVDALSERARKNEPGFFDAYWPNIVQVQFNAWHFVDANLWASLVSHILDVLSAWGKDDPDPVQKAKTEALDNLRVTTEARAAAAARLEQAKDAHEKAVRVRDKRIAAFNSRRREFALAIGKDVWQEVANRLGAVGPDDCAHLKELGITVGQTGADAQRMYAQLTELQALPGRLYAAGTLIAGSGVWKPALGLFVALTAGVLVLAVYAGDARTLVGVLGQGAAVVISGALWLGRGMKRVSSALEPLQRLHGNLGTLLTREQARKAAQVAELDKEVQRLQTDCAEATKVLDQALQKVQAAQAEIEAVETGRLITRFIEQRASSSDYRKHLGIVSLIRDDFDRLSRLIKAYNDSRLRPVEPGTVIPADLGINRIILYIDDLDRCPPDRVVEVLQAIHLLLAFPLFVVVVAVDARWMSTSLQTQYTGMLKERGASRAGSSDATTPPATPRDYLEKIFQVPFWVQPMVPAGCQSLIEELLKFDIAADAGAGGATTGGPRGDAQTGSNTVVVQGSAPAKGVDDPSPDRLMIDNVEATAMAQLAPIIGRSPRATKRFVNVYRLLKAALPADQIETFVDPGAMLGGFRAPMLLLAVTTGLPMLTPTVFNEIGSGDRAVKAATRRVRGMFKEVLAGTLDGATEDLAEERRRLALFLTDPENAAWIALPVAQLRPWTVRIAQFTFDVHVV